MVLGRRSDVAGSYFALYSIHLPLVRIWFQFQYTNIGVFILFYHLLLIFLLTPPFFRQIFDMYDKNGDNVINVEELRGILEILGYSPSPEEVKTILGEQHHDNTMTTP